MKASALREFLHVLSLEYKGAKTERIFLALQQTPRDDSQPTEHPTSTAQRPAGDKTLKHVSGMTGGKEVDDAIDAESLVTSEQPATATSEASDQGGTSAMEVDNDARASTSSRPDAQTGASKGIDWPTPVLDT